MARDARYQNASGKIKLTLASLSDNAGFTRLAVLLPVCPSTFCSDDAESATSVTSGETANGERAECNDK